MQEKSLIPLIIKCDDCTSWDKDTFIKACNAAVDAAIEEFLDIQSELEDLSEIDIDRLLQRIGEEV